MLRIASEKELDDLISEPSDYVVDMMRRLSGDIAILGANGKMGISLAMTARKAVLRSGVAKRILAVSRFSDPEGRKKLEDAGIETSSCDLLDIDAVRSLPHVQNVIFMAGKKFGTSGNEAPTWATNLIAPSNACIHYKGSRIVAFSTGCVYSLVSKNSGGSTEDDAPVPLGEYANSSLGRERIFQYYSSQHQTPTLLYRLNYSSDLRYGVLHDIGSRIWNGEPVSRNVAYFNIIWQGDANNYALAAIEHCSVPASILNVTGAEILSLQETVEKMGKIMDRTPHFTGEGKDLSYLNNASKSFKLFGKSSIGGDDLIRMQAEWIMQGGKALGKPTHFEVNNGKF